MCWKLLRSSFWTFWKGFVKKNEQMLMKHTQRRPQRPLWLAFVTKCAWCLHNNGGSKCPNPNKRGSQNAENVAQSYMLHAEGVQRELFLTQQNLFLWQNSTWIHLLNSLRSLSKWILVEFCHKNRFCFVQK